jgi:RNA polymerase sigma-70 factor (ECF subfamily)
VTTPLLFAADFADRVDRARRVEVPEVTHQDAVTLSSDDAALLERIRAGDEAAFSTLFLRDTPKLYAAATALTGSADVAADVVQSVMHYLWQRRETLVIRGSLLSYLRAATVNASRNALRSAARSRQWAERAAATLATSVAPSSASDDANEDNIRLLAVLERAIEALPQRTREIFLLWWGGEFTYQEIAQATGISVKGVERARARALGQLRAFLIEQGFGPQR